MSCQVQCRPLPEHAESVDEFVFTSLEVYAECRFLHEQCSAAVSERILKEK